MTPFFCAANGAVASKLLNACLHYSDNWEVMGDGDWDDTYNDPQVSAAPSTASHRFKHGRLEDAYKAGSCSN
jgi:hypothetical protein